MAKIIRINARPAYEARIEAENRAYTRHAMQILDSFASQLIPANMPEVHVRLPQRVPVRTIVAPRNPELMHVHSSVQLEENSTIDAIIEAMLRSDIRFSAIASHMPV
ncbi:MAG: hypothetical protein IJZ68_06165 [Bacteroidaceae bacterium]|nr:hypothetical protein [Bacteroidaceae bacterium]